MPFYFQGIVDEVTQIVPSSSDEELNISINTDDDEETEEQIIERRRKQREQLMKVSYKYIYRIWISYLQTLFFNSVIK